MRLYTCFLTTVSLLFSFAAFAQSGGRSSELAYSPSSELVNQAYDADFNSRKAIYKEIIKEPTKQDPDFMVDMKKDSPESIEKRLSEQYQNEVPNQLAISIKGAARDRDANKLIEIVRKAANKQKLKAERAAALKAQDPNGKLPVGAQGAIDRGGSHNLKGKFSITGGLGKNKRIMLRWKKDFYAN